MGRNEEVFGEKNNSFLLFLAKKKPKVEQTLGAEKSCLAAKINIWKSRANVAAKRMGEEDMRMKQWEKRYREDRMKETGRGDRG